MERQTERQTDTYILSVYISIPNKENFYSKETCFPVTQLFTFYVQHQTVLVQSDVSDLKVARFTEKHPSKRNS